MRFILFVCLALVWSCVICPEPPLWHEWFSQSMTVSFRDLNTTASYWYDSELGAERYDFANGNTLSGCGSIYHINTPCTHLITNGWFFMIYPEKNLCCKLYEAEPKLRTWMQNYTFKGQQQIDNTLFNIWDEGINAQFDELFYTEAQNPQRPRRKIDQGRIFFDYWLNSFNSSRPKASLFNVPEYCQKRCGERFENEEDYKRLQRELRKVHVGLLEEQQSFEKFSIVRQ